MAYTRILTVKGADGTVYAVDKWKDRSTSKGGNPWRYPSRLMNITDSRRVTRWETGQKVSTALYQIQDALAIAVDGLERLLVEHMVEPAEIIVTKDAPFTAADLSNEIDVDCSITGSRDNSIRA